jgi:FlaA1/EpsC-like NDP-sugar epimerase
MPVTRHRLWHLAADAVMIAAAWYLAFQLRFDFAVPPYYDRMLGETLWLVLAINLAVFVAFGFYQRWWRYVSIRDMWRALLGVAFAWVIAVVAVYLLYPVEKLRLPRAVAILDLLLLLAFVAGSRLLARTVIDRPKTGLVARGKKVLIVGAGDAGQLILRELQRSKVLDYTPIGLVDDNPRWRGGRLLGVRVLGNTADLKSILRNHRPDEVLIAIPSAPGEVRQRVVEIAREENVPVKTLPGLYELLQGDLDLAGQIRPVQVEDLLGREPVEVDLAAITAYLRNQTVLVTGAGGSIGSELCRQISRADPARIVLVDQSETALFDIERELVDERGFTAGFPVLADVKNRNRMRQVFEKYAPTVVFHAAAYKHVPLMEANPLESVRNNVVGTRVVAEAAMESGAERFVLISTDKALNPNSVYGQSKTLCEWIVAAHGGSDVRTRFVAVRFGNVLNSTGSVIPIFKRQIERGGPLTVTDPEMTRFFMTIPEATALVIQAGAIGGRGQIFVLDMGEPIRILELARNMIALSGRDPDRDVEIKFIGARPGEKIHEELFAEGETWRPTAHAKILALDVEPIDRAWLDGELTALERLVEDGATLELVSRLSAIVREPKRGAVSARRVEDVAPL